MTTSPLQEYLDKVSVLVKKHGWAVQMVMATPPFSYTVGLTAKDLPELIVVGLEGEVARAILNDCAKLLVGGMALEAGKNYDQIFRGFPARFAKLPGPVARRHLSVARALSGTGRLVEAWQLLWPDREGHFPGEPGMKTELEAAQSLSLLGGVESLQVH